MTTDPTVLGGSTAILSLLSCRRLQNRMALCSRHVPGQVSRYRRLILTEKPVNTIEVQRELLCIGTSLVELILEASG